MSLVLRAEEIAARYRVELLTQARIDRCGVCHAGGAIAWGAIAHALAAEIGEPEGVCTVLFDLVLASDPSGYDVARIGVDPGEEAAEVARGLARALAPERLDAGLKGLAVDGVARQWFPDPGAFAERALAQLARVDASCR